MVCHVLRREKLGKDLLRLAWTIRSIFCFLIGKADIVRRGNMKISVILWNPSHSDCIRILQIAHRRIGLPISISYSHIRRSYCLHCDTANLLCLQRHTSTRATQINRTKSYQLRSNFCSHTLMRGGELRRAGSIRPFSRVLIFDSLEPELQRTKPNRARSDDGAHEP